MPRCRLPRAASGLKIAPSGTWAAVACYLTDVDTFARYAVLGSIGRALALGRELLEGGERRIVDGPFAETKELIAGFWLWQVTSMDEAMEWARRSSISPTAPTPSAAGAATAARCRRGSRR